MRCRRLGSGRKQTGQLNRDFRAHSDLVDTRRSPPTGLGQICGCWFNTALVVLSGGDGMKIATINHAYWGRGQRGFLLAIWALLGVCVMPAQAQMATQTELMQDENPQNLPEPPRMPGYDLNVSPELVTTVRYEGGTFEESSSGWTQTTDTGETFTYDVIRTAPNHAFLHDPERFVSATFAFQMEAVFIFSQPDPNESAQEERFLLTSIETAERDYERPTRPDGWDIKTIDFEGGQLRYVSTGRWVRRNNDGRCDIFRVWRVNDEAHQIFDEVNDVLIAIYPGRMLMTIVRRQSEPNHYEEIRLTGVSADRTPVQAGDCTSSLIPASLPTIVENEGEFPVDYVAFRAGSIFLTGNGHWWHAWTGEGQNGLQDFDYDIVDSGADTLILHNDEYDLTAVIELANRSIRIADGSGIVNNQYWIMADPDQAAAIDQTPLTAIDMETIDYDGGQFVRTECPLNWIKVFADTDHQVGYFEWARSPTTLTLVSMVGGFGPPHRIEIDTDSMTAVTSETNALNDGTGDPLQLTEIGYEPSEVRSNFPECY